jgi:hypothetical protein
MREQVLYAPDEVRRLLCQSVYFAITVAGHYNRDNSPTRTDPSERSR